MYLLKCVNANEREWNRKIKTVLVFFKSLVEKAREQSAEEVLQRALNMFKCDKDEDIESFLLRECPRWLIIKGIFIFE